MEVLVLCEVFADARPAVASDAGAARRFGCSVAMAVA